MAIEIWNHHKGYLEAYKNVLAQDLAADLKLIDDLYGRDELSYGASDEEVKEEALRQLEREYRSERNERAEFFVNVARASR